MNKMLFKLLAILALMLPIGAAARDGDNTTKGYIQALSTEGVQVLGVSYIFDGDVEFENNFGQQVPFSTFAVGNRVELKWSFSGGVRLVREMELLSAISATPTPSPTVAGTPTAVGTPSSDNRVSRRNRSTEFKRRLQRLVTTVASARVEYKAKRNDVRLKLKVKLPPNTVPLVTNISEAELLQFTATISRASVVLATCVLEIDDDSDDDSNDDDYFEYKLDLREKRGSTREKYGSCDVATIPALARGDVVSISEASNGELFEGSL